MVALSNEVFFYTPVSASAVFWDCTSQLSSVCTSLTSVPHAASLEPVGGALSAPESHQQQKAITEPTSLGHDYRETNKNIKHERQVDHAV